MCVCMCACMHVYVCVCAIIWLTIPKPQFCVHTAVQPITSSQHWTAYISINCLKARTTDHAVLFSLLIQNVECTDTNTSGRLISSIWRAKFSDVWQIHSVLNPQHTNYHKLPEGIFMKVLYHYYKSYLTGHNMWPVPPKRRLDCLGSVQHFNF